MKRLFIFVLLVLPAIGIAQSQSASAFTDTEAAAVYNEAGQFYQQQQYEQALAKYEELIQAGVDHPDVYYNASNAAYRSGNLGTAVLYIERSLRLRPGDEDARANHSFLNTIKADRDPVNSNPLIMFFTNRYESFNVHRAAVVSLISWVATLILGTCGLFLRKWKRIALITVAGFSMIVWLVASGTLIQKTRYQATVNEAVVMQTEVSSYSGPGTENTRIFSIHEGTVVVIERTEGSWALIRLKSGAAGWIKREVLVSI